MWKTQRLRKTASGLRTLVCVPDHGVESLNVGVLMHDLDYVLELADSYNCALITRDELQDEIHSCSVETIMYAVNALDEYHGHDAATAFIVVADLPLYWEPVPIPEELKADPECDDLPEGYWDVDKSDVRVKDFPPDNQP
jgi:hypothetical protein